MPGPINHLAELLLVPGSRVSPALAFGLAPGGKASGLWARLDGSSRVLGIVASFDEVDVAAFHGDQISLAQPVTISAALAVQQASTLFASDVTNATIAPTHVAVWSASPNPTGSAVRSMKWADFSALIPGTVGPVGPAGDPGDKGWSPILAVQPDGNRSVLQLFNWTGGAGTAPGSGSYIGTGGLVPTIALGADIRGPQGIQGIQGIQGPTGNVGGTGAQGPKGDKGDPGIKGDKGDTGAKGDQGVQGNAGPGVAAGGSAGMFLKKTSAADFVTAWATIQILDVANLPGAIEFCVSSGSPQTAGRIPIFSKAHAAGEQAVVVNSVLSQVTGTPNRLKSDWNLDIPGLRLGDVDFPQISQIGASGLWAIRSNSGLTWEAFDPSGGGQNWSLALGAWCVAVYAGANVWTIKNAFNVGGIFHNAGYEEVTFPSSVPRPYVMEATFQLAGSSISAEVYLPRLDNAPGSTTTKAYVVIGNSTGNSHTPTVGEVMSLKFWSFTA